MPKSFANYYRNNFPQFAKKAQKIITVSEYSANDISKTYEVDRAKIFVAHNGGNDKYSPLTDSQKIKAQKDFGQGDSYFIFVGSFSNRKNIHGIVKSFGLYRDAGGNSKLVLVGNPLWNYPEMDDALSESDYADHIIFTGHLSIEDLCLALGGSKGLVFPSYFEGFGIPIVEAFAAGVPVICSDRTSLPEVAGEAALYAGPDDHAKISEHMMALEKNNDLSKALIDKGFNRLPQFSWNNTANKIADVLFP